MASARDCSEKAFCQSFDCDFDVTRDMYKLNFKNELCKLTYFAEQFASKEYFIV